MLVIEDLTLLTMKILCQANIHLTLSYCLNTMLVIEDLTLLSMKFLC
jgi:hypothetical protein